MAKQVFEREERQFLAAVGLDTDDLEWLAAEAPAPPAGMQERVLALLPAYLPKAQTRSKRGWRRAAVAAAALLITCVGTVALSPTAQGALQSLLRLIPGFGIAEVQPGSMQLAQPVTVRDGERTLTVTALYATPGSTTVQLEWGGVTLPVGEQATGRPEGAELVLTNGTRLTSGRISANWQSGSGRVLMSFQLPALPAGTRTARLELPALFGITNPVTADLALTALDPSKLPPVVEVGQPDEKLGVKATVTAVAVDGDRIDLELVTAATGPGLQWAMPDLEQDQFTLLDEKGNAYPLLWDESARASAGQAWVPSPDTLRQMAQAHGRDPAAPLSLVFQGPLREGAHTLRLNIWSMRVGRPDAAELAVPWNLKASDPARVMQVGDQTFTVQRVERPTDSTVAIYLKVGTGALASFTAKVDGQRVRDYDSNNGNIRLEAEVAPAAGAESLQLRIENPVLTVNGPWTIELKLP